MPTAAELNALAYASAAPINTGHTLETFRKQYQGYGLRLRWWKAFPAPTGAVGPNGEARQPNGCIYVEQSLDDTVRCILYNTKRELFDAEHGAIEVGQTAIAVLPDEVELARLDRVSFPDVAWLRRGIVQRGEGGSDALPNVPVVAIEKVYAFDGSEADADDYEVTEGGGGITWLANAPAAEALYIVEYRQEVRFEFVCDEQAVVQLGADGKRLPQRGIIRMVNSAEIEL